MDNWCMGPGCKRHDEIGEEMDKLFDAGHLEVFDMGLATRPDTVDHV